MSSSFLQETKTITKTVINENDNDNENGNFFMAFILFCSDLLHLKHIIVAVGSHVCLAILGHDIVHCFLHG